MAKGSHVSIDLNGKRIIDRDDAKFDKNGVIGLQLHVGPPMEVRYKDLKIRELSAPSLTDSHNAKETARVSARKKAAPRDRGNSLLEATQMEMENLRGTWDLISNEMDGKDLPQIPREKWSLTLTGDKFTHMRGNTFIGTGVWRSDLTKTPKQIVATDEGGRSLLGIYERDGETRRVCWGKTTPTEFKTEPGSARQLAVSSRSKR